MHAIGLIRGSIRDVDRFLDEIQAKYLPIYQAGVEDVNHACNIVARTYQIVELIFPEEQLQRVLNTVKPENGRVLDKKTSFMLKRIFKAEDAPELDPKVLPMPVWKHNMEFILIGIKKDCYNEQGEELI